MKLDYEWDREGAQREFRRALELSPGSGWVRHWYAHSLEAQGRLDEAMKEMRAALDLDPLSVAVHWDIDSELIYAGRYDEASERAGQDLELFPDLTNPFCSTSRRCPTFSRATWSLVPASRNP